MGGKAKLSVQTISGYRRFHSELKSKLACEASQFQSKP
jgi:hypothetical protein